MNGGKINKGLEVLAAIALAALAVSVMLTGCGRGLAADWATWPVTGWL